MDWTQLTGVSGIDKLPGGRFSAPELELRGGPAVLDAASRGSLDLPGGAVAEISSGGVSSARRLFLFGQQIGDFHEVVGKHSCSNQQLKAISALRETSLHAATSQQHRDAPFDAGAKALTLLEVCALLVDFALRSSLATALRNAHHFDTIVLAGCQVLFTEEPAIRAVQFRDPGSTKVMLDALAVTTSTWLTATAIAFGGCRVQGIPR